jgi:hypothetical protein
MPSYIFKYEKDGKLLGYQLDTFCNFGPQSHAKLYNVLYHKIDEFTKEKQEQVNWHISLGSKDLEGVKVVAERVTEENFPHDNYTLVK